MSKRPGWRAATVRVLANAVLVLLALEVVAIVGVAIVAETRFQVTPAEAVPLAAGWILGRWVVVLPVLLPALAGLDYAAGRTAHPRVLAAIVAFAPMVLWELTMAQGGSPSVSGVGLGVTAVLFTILVRLPGRADGRSAEGHGPAQPPAEPVVTPR
jgi:hypothetical protein